METNSNNTVAADAAIRTSPTCFVCKKAMAEQEWFCRLTRKAKEAAEPQAAKILLCSPACALRYFAVKTELTTSTESKARDL